MLRLFVLLLLAANVAYFAWSHDMLGGLGLGVASQSEPQRLKQQIEPERIRILKPNEPISIKSPSAANNLNANESASASDSASITNVSTTVAANAALSTCLQAGMFNEQQAGALRQALVNNLPTGTWRLDAVSLPAQWIVYMGKYPNTKTRDFKKYELSKIKVPFQGLTDASLEPGISLGRHPTQAAANLALDSLFKQGVRTAKVLEERTNPTGFQLVLPAVNDTLRTKLNNVRSQLAGKPLLACKN